MLYPKNQAPQLPDELFRHPTSEYRAAPFWAWNCKLEKDELLRQLDILRKMGMGGAHMHVRTGMATPYLSDEFMSLIKVCTDKCRDEGMLAWLYDEDRWPSGAAGGIVCPNRGMALIVEECFTEGTVQAAGNAGGIMSAAAEYWRETQIRNCYSSCKVTSQSGLAGGIAAVAGAVCHDLGQPNARLLHHQHIESAASPGLRPE